jgi:hypothetical protein
MADIPPIFHGVVKTLGGIGYRALSAAVSTALKGVGEITEEIDRRVKRGSRAANKMANGQPYDPNDEDEETDDG